jgi:hypothetical protein
VVSPNYDHLLYSLCVLGVRNVFCKSADVISNISFFSWFILLEPLSALRKWLKEKSSGRDPLLLLLGIPQPFAGCPGITLPV